MSEENSGHKKLIAILVLLLLLVGIGFFIAWFKPSQISPDGTDSTFSGFSSFDRPTTDRAVNVTRSDKPYTYIPNTTPEPIQQQTIQQATQQRSQIINDQPSQQIQYLTSEPVYQQSFNIPQSTKTTEPERVYSQEKYIGITSTYVPYTNTSDRPDYIIQVPANSSSNNQKSSDEYSPGLGEQIFGYFSGLGWMQYTGEFGRQWFGSIYGSTPTGIVGVGKGGSGGGGGAGMMAGGFGGGGGATTPFGGMVTRVTYCTCSASTMLDINDVNTGNVSLIYQGGASQLYSNYNVYGTGQNVLGTYTSGGSCLVYYGTSCSSEGSPQGTIVMIGTSVE